MASSDPPSGDDGERDVFGSLPNTRPQRRSARRDRPGGAAKPAGAAASPRAEAKPKPKPAAAKAKPAARKRAAPSTTAREAAAPRAESPIPPAGYATPREDDGVPRGAHLVTTAVQAAGELAQIGLAAGGRALKSAFGRLPRP